VPGPCKRVRRSADHHVIITAGGLSSTQPVLTMLRTRFFYEASKMTSESQSLKQSNPELFYIRLTPPNSDLNGPSKPPIIFLHGLESNHTEFSRVTPFLSADYDLILVDLPGHSSSKHILPLTLENAANAVSHLISTKVDGRKAHIVGLSLGGYVGLDLARRYPEQVLSLFCTGCAPDSGLRRAIMSQARLLAGVGLIGSRFSNEKMFWAPIGVDPVPGLREVFRGNQSMALLTAGYETIHEFRLEDVGRIEGVRIAIVAGAKRDSVKDTMEAGRVMVRKNEACRAFVVRDAVHLWDVQFPELFAQGVRAWVNAEEMPKEFERL
jgi:pimeloyl-ACP methyl ester carboxylesterase